jgi:integrase
LRYAVATRRVQHDVSSDLRGTMVQVKGNHRAAITDPNAIDLLLRAIDGYQGYLVTCCALRLRLAPLVFVCPGELRKAEWPEFDLDAGH